MRSRAEPSVPNVMPSIVRCSSKHSVGVSPPCPALPSGRQRWIGSRARSGSWHVVHTSSGITGTRVRGIGTGGGDSGTTCSAPGP
jgi:hypothetical protein